MQRSQNNRGFVLIETLIYIVITVVLLTIVIVTLVHFSRINDDLRVTRALHSTVVSVHTNIENTMRVAEGVNEAGSFFDVYNGKLALTMSEDGSSERVFQMSDDDIVFFEDGEFLGPLNPDSIRVSSLFFSPYTEGDAYAIEMTLTLQADFRNGVRAHTFRTLYIPRHIYEE